MVQSIGINHTETFFVLKIPNPGKAIFDPTP
jgi:hypothetical protein